MCLPQVIKSFQNYRGVATTFYPTLVFKQEAQWITGNYKKAFAENSL